MRDETLIVQSGKPVGILQTHKRCTKVLISNSQLVPNWANWKHFDELEKKGLDDVQVQDDGRKLDLYWLSRNCAGNLTRGPFLP